MVTCRDQHGNNDTKNTCRTNSATTKGNNNNNKHSLSPSSSLKARPATSCWDVLCKNGLKQNPLPSLRILLLPQTFCIRTLLGGEAGGGGGGTTTKVIGERTITTTAPTPTTEEEESSAAGCIMKCNLSLEYINLNTLSLQCVPTQRIKYYLDLNRGGRRIISTSMSTSTSTTLNGGGGWVANNNKSSNDNNNYCGSSLSESLLWPIILARASTIATSLDYTTSASLLASIVKAKATKAKNTANAAAAALQQANNTTDTNTMKIKMKKRRMIPMKKQSVHTRYGCWDGESKKRRYDVVYCLLRNRILLEL